MAGNKLFPGWAANELLGNELNRLFRGLESLGTPLPKAAPTNSLAVSSVFGLPYDPLAPSSALGGLSPVNWLAASTEVYRRRQEWNDRFAHWERSESDAETQRIERARNMVQSALGGDAWLRANGAQIIPQGSFTNRTNTRLEADIDLRVQLPLLKVEYGPGVDPQLGWAQGGYYDTGTSFEQFNQAARVSILAALYNAFGIANVDNSGNKAIRIKGVEGSRGEVDVVPVFTLHRIMGTSLLGQYKHEGVAILGNNGNWTANYPEQHLANGRAKRMRTGYQFKRVVRIVKRLRADMEDRGLLAKRPPSFLIECLIYMVEDSYFTWALDDRYDRVKRVLTRASEILASPLLGYTQTEINGIKPLFGNGQAWTYEEAQSFVRAALAHLGNA